MKIKDFLQKKYLIFYLVILSFIFLMVAALAIGVETKDTHVVFTVLSIADNIKVLNQMRINPPQVLTTTYGLIVSGLIFSGSSLILFILFLLPIQKFIKVKNWFWWIGILFVLVAFVLVLAGETYFIVESMDVVDPTLTFKDLWMVSRFIGLIICIVVLPLAIIILNFFWYSKYIKNVQSKTKAK